MKILVIEDEISLQQAIVSFLEKEEHLCEVASDYDEGMYKVSLYNYDVILLDLPLLCQYNL